MARFRRSKGLDLPIVGTPTSDVDLSAEMTVDTNVAGNGPASQARDGGELDLVMLDLGIRGITCALRGSMPRKGRD